MDRRHERRGLYGDGLSGQRTAGVGQAIPESLPRIHGGLRRPEASPLLRSLPGSRPGESRSACFAQVRGQRVSSPADDFVRYLPLGRTILYRNPNTLARHHARGIRHREIDRLGTLLEQTGAIRLRSDVERKRLFGLSPLDQSSGEIKAVVYGRETRERPMNAC